MLGEGGTSENENGAYHVCVLAPQAIADCAWPDWRYWTANDIISILYWYRVWINVPLSRTINPELQAVSTVYEVKGLVKVVSNGRP